MLTRALLLCALSGAAAVSVVGGGFAAQFRGSKHSEMRSKYVDSVPTTALTISYHMRVDRPADSARDWHEGYSGFHWYAKADELDERHLTVSGFDDLYLTVGTSGNMATTISLAGDNEWHHLVFQWASETGEVLAFMDPGTDAEVAFNSTLDNDGETMSQGLVLPSSAWFALGQGYWEAEHAFVGQQDDFAVYDRVLSYAEVVELGSKTAASVAADDLQLYFSFDEDRVDTLVEPQAFDAVSGSYFGVMDDAVDDLAMGFGDETFPTHVVSPLKLAGAKAIAAVLTEATVTLTLECDACDAVRITSDPTSGSLQQSTGEAIGAGAQVSHADGDVVFVGTLAAGAVASFGFSVHSGADFANGTAVVLGNTAPVTNNITASVSETGEAVVFLFERDAAYDVDHADLSFYISSLPDPALLEVYQFTYLAGYYDDDGGGSGDDSGGSGGSGGDDDYYYEYFEAGDQLTEDLLPILVTDDVTRILLVPGADAQGGEQLSFKYYASDGAADSEAGWLLVEVEDENFVPAAFAHSVPLLEDAVTLVTLNASDPEGDLIYPTVTALPEHGTLYQFDADSDDEMGAEVTLDSSAQELRQWATSAAATSAWPTSDGGNDAEQMTGEPDIYPLAADTFQVWQPAECCTFNTLDLEYDEPVFATSLELYETWSRGSVVAVRLWNDATDEWVTAFEQDPQIEFLNPDPSVFVSFITSVQLCPQQFAASKVQVDIDIVSLEYWVAIDAVQLVGTAAALPKTVLDASLRLWYSPDADYNGADSFTYAVNDCGYFSVSRTLYEADRSADVAFAVAAVNDAPVVEAQELTAWDNAALTFELDITDVDSAGDVVATQASGAAVARVSDTSFTYTPALCDTPLNPYTVTLTFEAEDGAGASSAEAGTVTISVACSPQVYELDAAIGTIILAVSLLVFVYVCGIAAAVFKHRRTRIIKCATPTFCFGILFFLGMAALGANTMALTPVEGDADGVCLLRAWACAVPLVGSLGALLAKTMRISKLFNNKSLRKVSIKTTDLLRWASSALAVEVLLLIALSAGGLTEYEVVDGEGTTLGYAVEQCSENAPWQVVQMIYVFSMLLFAGYQAFRVRNADAEFNEAPNIAATTFLLLFNTLILVPLQWTLDSPEAVAFIRGLGMLFATASITSVLFLPKLFTIYTGLGDKAAATSSRNQGTVLNTSAPATKITVVSKEDPDAAGGKYKVAASS